jgi:8-oxo-dGTP diphosphatase
MKSINKVGAAIIRNKKLLIVKEEGWTLYGVPGGKPKPGESDCDCLKREISEELDADVKKDSFEYLGTFEDVAMNEPETTVKIKFYKVEIKKEPKPTADVVEMGWFSRKDNPDILGPIDRNKLIPALIEKDII